ncbi:divergent polysaccharide deacetylase family protein [Sporosalibacterium faouarense]|uniref:divergent polysaccharide deacetylase family protein n=1 Tax=Sporosalibacterium faouarense TaxID=516123 RepID=UPI00141C2C1D|nr:divergent polysaccharide deacetylase family protein [Sporosalibacterium faouarense]MTI46385.1 divergent polysaccharide deacetylase family protein [Bacillota bacterium]
MFIIISKKRLTTIFMIIILTLIIISIISTIHTNTIETNSRKTSYIAIIIDDFGNNSQGTEDMYNLNIPLTAAVMPFQPFSESDAQAAHEAKLEVILHIPMEPEHGKKEWLGPRGITDDLSNEEIQSCIEDSLSQIPFAVGMNNHMGSKITQDERIIESVLKIIKDRNLFFIDSKTTPKSVIPDISKNLNVKFATRDIFLDGTQNQNHIEKQIEKLGEIALERGYAIGIGHVGVEGGTVTAKAIKSMYPKLQNKDIKFVYISDIINLIYENNVY